MFLKGLKCLDTMILNGSQKVTKWFLTGYLDIGISTFVSRPRYISIDPDPDIDTLYLEPDIGISTSIRTSTPIP